MTQRLAKPLARKHPGRGAGRMGAHAAKAAWALWAGSAAFVASSFVLDYHADLMPTDAPAVLITLFTVLSLAYPTVGALVASRRPENPIGWIFCCFGLVNALQVVAASYAAYAWPRLPGALHAAWLASWVALPAVMLTTVLLLLLFPSGRLPSGMLFPEGRAPAWSWQTVVWMAICGSLIVAVGEATRPGPLQTWFSLGQMSSDLRIGNPFGWRPSADGILVWVWDAGGKVGLYLYLVSLVFALVSLISRFVLARDEVRLQIRWFVAAAALLFAGLPVALLGGLPLSLFWFPIIDYLWTIGIVASVSGFMLFPVTVGIAILRHRLYGIDRIFNRALVYGALTSCVVGLYVVVVGAAGVLFQRGNLLVSLLATGVVALLFHPLRVRLQRGANHLMYGHRDEPYAVLSRLGKRLERSITPEAALTKIVEVVVQELKLPYAAVDLKLTDGGFDTAAERGEPTSRSVVVPLVHHGEEVGRLVAAPRAADETFVPSEMDLLEGLARQAGAVVHAARLGEETLRLSTDLQRSRERLVAAREEERRRLRRDLHDGVGPQLASLMLELETASDLVSGNPEASALMAKLSERARKTVSDVRRSVHGLRPPALDELGLVGALKEIAARYSSGGLMVSVETPGEFPPLPAAVEVACYLIAQEALTNAVRHASASRCRVRVGLDEEALSVEIQDDGRGIAEDSQTGVGMCSMRERAEELGGTLTVGPRPQGGTLVRATLPRMRGDASPEEEE